jgi:hypothetical protein
MSDVVKLEVKPHLSTKTWNLVEVAVPLWRRRQNEKWDRVGSHLNFEYYGFICIFGTEQLGVSVQGLRPLSQLCLSATAKNLQMWSGFGVTLSTETPNLL